MSKPIRELTAQEARAIRKLVTGNCANFDREYGCLPLDCECVMLGKAFCGNAMCRYFRDAVLPNDPELEAALNLLPAKRCKQCGKVFPASGRSIYCSKACAEDAARAQTALRVRKHRAKKGAV